MVFRGDSDYRKYQERADQFQCRCSKGCGADGAGFGVEEGDGRPLPGHQAG